MYPMLMGEFEHVRDRIITVNGVLVHVPVRPGYAYVGIEMVPHDGTMMARACEFDGPGAERFGILKIGENELQTIAGMCEQSDGVPVPFELLTPLFRPKCSLN